MFDRRMFLLSLPGLVLGDAALAAAPVPGRSLDTAQLAAAVRAAEIVTGGRVGLAVTAGRAASDRKLQFQHRGSERFPMASTFKMLLAAAILAQVDKGKERLDRAIPVVEADIIANSPVAQKRVGATATVGELAEATMIYSDNAAANLLLRSIGGPAGMTAFVRRLGDTVTRLDRIEPAMSEARPGDPRDTTSPDAIVATWGTLLFGDVLSQAARLQLRQWLDANTTGNARLRAGLPSRWRVGDKTGTGGNNSVNDIAIVAPDPLPDNEILIACFLNGGTAAPETLNRVHADLASAVVAALGY